MTIFCPHHDSKHRHSHTPSVFGTNIVVLCLIFITFVKLFFNTKYHTY